MTTTLKTCRFPRPAFFLLCFVFTALGVSAQGTTRTRSGLEVDLTRIARSVAAVSVRIETEDGLGSGTIVHSHGHILTSAHVIEGCSDLRVTLSDGRLFQARLVGMNGRGDLALLDIAATGLPVALIGNADRLRAGEFVLASGHPCSPFDDFQPTLSTGRIRVLEGHIRASADKIFRRALVSDVPLSAGSSGGGLFDRRGQLVGVNAAVTRNERTSFSVRISEFLVDRKRLEAGERFDRAPKRSPRRKDWRKDRQRYARGAWFDSAFPQVQKILDEREVSIAIGRDSISGFVVSRSGDVLTKASALKPLRGRREVAVRLGKSKISAGQVVALDHKNNVALLRLPPRREGYRAFSLRPMSRPLPGAVLMTLGGRGLEGGMLSAGLRLAPNDLKGAQYAPEWLQCDLRLWSDQQGGPIVDSQGELVGMVTQHRLTHEDETVGDAPFGAFLVSREDLLESWTFLRGGRSRLAPQLGFLGVELGDLTQSELRQVSSGQGVRAIRVHEGHAGARGGLRDGDLILSIAHRTIHNRGQAIKAIGALTPGRPTTMEVLRDGRRRSLSLQIGTREKPVLSSDRR